MTRRLTFFALIAMVLAVGAVISVTSQNQGDGLSLRVYREHRRSGTPDVPVVERAAEDIRQTQGREAMVTFLTGHIQQFPDDPALSFYLTWIGDLYRRSEQPDIARQYHRRALLSAADAEIRGVSTHQVAIRSLLDIVDDPEERLEYLSMLEDRFSDRTEPGLLHYHFARAYEGIGEWDAAYAAYRRFLAYPATRVPGSPEAHELVRRRLAFYDSDRSWTARDLDTLVAQIKNALWRQDPWSLLRHRAGVNFFTMSWEQELGDANSQIPSFDIAAFLRRSRVRFAEELELTSNASEAYLRTWGWSHRIPTWYLYFRRIDFPADPEIHGTWEWAGIFFGEAI